MRRLILMRHAKSDWHQGVDDHDRPLNPRGNKAASALGRWLRGTGIAPDGAVISSSMRTIETFGRLDLDCPVRKSRRLYLAEASVILSEIQQEACQTLLVIGHNPGIAHAAAQCVAVAPDHPGFRHYPTGATLVVDFDAESWDAVAFETGKVRTFIAPRDLTDN